MSKPIEIFCPFCGVKIISSFNGEYTKNLKGQWQCNNGHDFVLEYLGKTPYEQTRLKQGGARK